MKQNLKNKEPLYSGSSVVRATFSLPQSCVEQLGKLQVRYARQGVILNRSELVRLGLAALEVIPSRDFKEALGGMERFKAGRPKEGV